MDSTPIAWPGILGNVQLEEARPMENQDPVLSGTNQNISHGDLNQNTPSQAIFVQLEDTLDASMQEVQDLAMKTIATSQVPLISARYTKSTVWNAVKDCKKINNIQSRLLALTLLTDQEVSGIVSNIVDIFHLTTNIGKIRALEQLGRAWAETFAEINLLHRASSLSLRKPSKEVMTVVLSFLRRQRALLEGLEDKTLGQSLLSKMNFQNQADSCFWNFSLETIDGRKKAPTNNWLKKPSSNLWKSDQPLTSTPSKPSPSPLSRFFSPILKLPSPSPSPPSPPSPPSADPKVVDVLERPEPGLRNLRDESQSAEPVKLKLAVKKINVSTYGFSNVEKKQICECEVEIVGDDEVDINDSVS